MLAPHHGEDAELGEVRRAAEDLFDALELVGRMPCFFTTSSVISGSDKTGIWCAR
jgi:hypothetical protein